MKKSMVLLPVILLAFFCIARPPAEHLPAVGANPLPASTKYIALTFDDGPHPVYTDRIVDTLEQYGAKGTFFILGSRISDHLPQLRHIAQSGSMIANHTWDHLDLTTLPADRLQRQIGTVFGSIRSLCGQDPWLVRPPYGFADEGVRQNCAYPIVCWSVDTLDWACLDADRVAAHILNHAEDGDIILMHDIYESTAQAVAQVVPALQARGFRLVTAAELFRLKGIPLESGHTYFHAKEK